MCYVNDQVLFRSPFDTSHYNEDTCIYTLYFSKIFRQCDQDRDTEKDKYREKERGREICHPMFISQVTLMAGDGPDQCQEPETPFGFPT